MGSILLFNKDAMPDHQFRSTSGIPSRDRRFDSTPQRLPHVLPSQLYRYFYPPPTPLEAWDCQKFLHTELFIIFANWPDWSGDTKRSPRCRISQSQLVDSGHWGLESDTRHWKGRDLKNSTVLTKRTHGDDEERQEIYEMRSKARSPRADWLVRKWTNGAEQNIIWSVSSVYI